MNLSHFIQKLIFNKLVLFCILFGPLPVLAEDGLPMILVFLPPMIFLFIPITILKAFIVKRRLNVSVASSYYYASIGNLFSTFAGLPFIWFDTLMITLGLSSIFKLSPFSSSSAERFLYSLLESPWLSSSTAQFDFHVAGFALMLMIFFMTSWLTEALVMYLIARKDYTFGEFSQASFKANLLSYIFLLISMPFFYTFVQWYAFLPRPIQGLIEDYKTIPGIFIDQLIEGVFKFMNLILSTTS